MTGSSMAEANLLAAPVTDTDDREPEPGIGIALSGGGYRAMLFHVGSLWRLYELGLLEKAQRVSSVSGGSITAGMLALAWPRLQWGDGGKSYVREVVDPIRGLASRSIDIPSILLGLPFHNAGFFIARAYRRHLYGQATLQDLPETPRFVINATNLHNGALWRFSRPYMGDWQMGRTPDPNLPLATAVAASSAFPPFLSPVRVPFHAAPSMPGDEPIPEVKRVRLTDGGVYDNLGLETVWKNYDTLFVSDGGGTLPKQKRPWSLWLPQAYRVLAIIQNQVGALRMRHLIASLLQVKPDPLAREGAYFGIATDPGTAPMASTLPCPSDRARQLAATRTALWKLPANYQERLINWGYAICDARVRQFYDPSLPEPKGFPFPSTGI